MIDRVMLKKAFAYLRGFILKLRVKTTGPIKVYGRIKIKNPRGKIIIGRRSKLFPGVTFDFESAPPGSTPEIRIGEFVHIGDRTEIHCGSQVTIGYRAGISWDVLIMGSDYHTDNKSSSMPQSIVIEELAWIYARATILKGVTIGKGAVVRCLFSSDQGCPAIHRCSRKSCPSNSNNRSEIFGLYH